MNKRFISQGHIAQDKLKLKPAPRLVKRKQIAIEPAQDIAKTYSISRAFECRHFFNTGKVRK
jgi:hypothetical protein